jgi:hypothetical protein
MKAAMTDGHVDNRWADSGYEIPWAAPMVAIAIAGVAMLGSYVAIAGTIMLLSTLLR